MRRELEHVEIPGEHEARERARRVVSTAFAEREPLPAPARRRLVPALALVAVAALAAATITSPGRALLHGIRETVGVEKAQPALFSLPAPGRLLVVSAGHGGVWIVHADGSKRRLGRYEDAAWSPQGRFVVALRPNELAALEPDGDVRWTLARPRVRSPRWGGSPIDTRIAYLSGNVLRVVAGDGTGDRALVEAPTLPRAPLAWRPGGGHVLAYVVDDVLRVVAVERGGAELWSARLTSPRAVAWSADGKRLLALSSRAVEVFAGGRRVSRSTLPSGARAVTAAFEPGGSRIALVLYFPRRDRSEVRIGERVVFSGTGRFTGVQWAPDGSWLVVAWPTADQWVFVRPSAERRIEAVSNLAAQFDGFPRIAGWCCAGS